MAVATARVSTTSGIRMRVNRNRPAQVASDNPANKPAYFEKAQAPKRAVTQHRAIADSAIGILAAQSWTPKIMKETAIIQYLSGDFSR